MSLAAPRSASMRSASARAANTAGALLCAVRRASSNEKRCICAWVGTLKKPITSSTVAGSAFAFPLRSRPWYSTYITGSTSKVSAVAVINPPITTVASGRCTSAPAPLLNAMGRKPSEATEAVISTGRRRAAVPWRTRSTTSLTPCAARSRKVPISTMPLSTATPNNAMKPTPADMLKGMPRSSKAATPPIALSGTAV